MKFAIVASVNGHFFIHAEGYDSADAAKVEYHNYCAALWNAEDVQTAHVAIVNEQLDVVDGYKENIHR